VNPLAPFDARSPAQPPARGSFLSGSYFTRVELIYSAGAVGLNWEVGGIAADALSAPAGTLDDSSQVAQLVQAMADFGGGAAADISNIVPLGAETSQQQSLPTTSHA
jgi:hypothetical protein